MTKNDLIARLQTLHEPDRAIDVAVLVSLDWREPDREPGDRTVREIVARHSVEWLVERCNSGMSVFRHLPRLTASVDAALALIPEGWQMGAVTLVSGGYNVTLEGAGPLDCVRAMNYPLLQCAIVASVLKGMVQYDIR